MHRLRGSICLKRGCVIKILDGSCGYSFDAKASILESMISDIGWALEGRRFRSQYMNLDEKHNRKKM
jgi:hypothetical protein